ncbi:uncharacterized protein [Mobula birostris]|uniref:uncharacterized protein isoform X1 n=1 Tax=Mobula birostris TaxID=1983395 RepID=UPI003B27C173
MDDSETYMNMKSTKTESRSLSRAEPAALYVEPKVTSLSVPRTDGETQRFGDRMEGSDTYMNMKSTKTDSRSLSRDKDKAFSSTILSSAPRTFKSCWDRDAGMGSERPPGSDRSGSSKWLIGVLTATLIITGICWGIHDRRLEMKYSALTEAKAQICQLLFSGKEPTCSKDWVRNKDRCYFKSTFETSYRDAKEQCSIFNSRLLEINSTEEENFVNKAVHDQRSSYWIGKCKAGKVASNVVYKMNAGKFECSECKSRWFHSCSNDQHRFICEKSAPLCLDISEKIKDLCQQPVGTT